MAVSRAIASSVDRFAAKLAAVAERVAVLERSSHRHNTPQTQLQPAGSVQFWIGETAPDGWALLNGQTLTNAETIYPALWAVVPAALKSGTDIVLPDCRGRVMVGRSTDLDFDEVGKTGGAKTVALTIPELPSHGHSGGTLSASLSGTVNVSGTTQGAGGHSHGGSVTGGAHGHSGNTVSTGAHAHPIPYVPNSGSGTNTFGVGLTGPLAGTLYNTQVTGDHTHTVTIPSSGAHSHTIAFQGNHQHDFFGSGSLSGAGVTLTGSTGNTGSGDGHQNLQPYLTLSPIIKLV